MRQQELASLVEGLKTEFSKAPRLNRRSISDRATGANLAALDLLLDSAKAVEEAPGKTEQARTLKALSNEFTEISDVIRTLGPR
ncbi:hypothetical protein GQF03_03850 [Sneathiella chungangensis]|uniref:Uncharacterized protein n=1 Tax=Sneathiella chungangensis TaxID=1418234 RepID=A0A845MDZ2_9PROT|nr:hypothetical protein [Sneathiella chungangensis]MZR21457.1 hypothetical protein [Sneathiella chungangensis]